MYAPDILPVTEPTVSMHWRELRSLTPTWETHRLDSFLLDQTTNCCEKAHCTFCAKCHLPDNSVYDHQWCSWCMLLIWVCVSLCTTVVHSTAQNSFDNFPSYPPD